MERIEKAAEELGYRGTSGYVDGSSSEVGARDFVWRDLKGKCGIDAAYFRGAVPLVAFVDAQSEVEVTQAHRRLWNFGRVPVLIAATPQEVSVLSCVRPPSLMEGVDSPVLGSARTHQRLESVLQEFTRFSVESGRAAAAHQDQFDRRLRVDYRLLENLRLLRTRLVASELDAADIERVLGRSIFIRYLEDRGILSHEHLRELGPFDSYVETLNAGPTEVSRLFGALSEHFNGDVFTPSKTESDLPAQALAELGQFFSGAELRSGQQSLFPYDFGVIPPELISSIYEQLLEGTQQEDAAYYTPRHVVDLVLDELVPWYGDPAARQSVLDPACGSGIFLTEAFRRFAYRHVVADGRQPTFESLSELLTTSVYGVDKSAAAIGVSAFGLYLALLEHVDPPTAWREGRLPQLVGTNLVVSDFFEDHPLSGRQFDLVVGNPPWKSALSPAAAKYVRKQDLKLPDQQIALAFLWRASDYVLDSGAVGLVLPAKGLLHNRSKPAEAARRQIFQSMAVETIVDLSPLRKETFGSATNPASIAIVRGQRRDQDMTDIVHVSPRRTPLANAIDGIVVSQENIRQLPAALTRTSTYVWKANLWGGPADFRLTTHLRETFPSLETVAERNEWVSRQGFQVKGGDQNDARKLVGMKLLATSSVEALRLTAAPSETVTDSVMHRPRDPRIYRAPHVVMRKGFSDYPMSAFVDFDAAFTDGLFGLAGPPRDAQALRVVAGLLNSSVARYWYFMTSSSWGVEREQIQLSEYLSLPIPPVEGGDRHEIIKAVKMAARAGSRETEWARILDAAVFRAYGLTPAEKDLVRDGLASRLDEYRRGPLSTSYQSPAARELASYARILSSQLNTTSSIRWSVELVDQSSGYAAVACRSSVDGAPEQRVQMSVDKLLSMADPPLDGWRSPAAVMQPSVIVVEGTIVYLVKPDERRCWTRSAARSDAPEVLSAVVMAPIADPN